MRPTWDEYFMVIANDVAKRSTCVRRRVGALLVKDNRIVATGYNGAPRKLTHCGSSVDGCVRLAMNVPSGQRHELCRGVHAEMNAVAQAARHGTSVSGSTLYCTTQPCVQCLKVLINVGVDRIVYDEPYEDPLAAEMVPYTNIAFVEFNKPEDLE
jgi:dCMP deaminase